MKNREEDAKLVMLEHSKAKVDLYSKYLSTYLNILSRVDFIKGIRLYDLMCGEGIYLDNSKGSPIVAMQSIKEHYFSNNNSCPNIKVWFNDKDKSEIEPNRYKIERVKDYISNMFIPSNVFINYSKEDFKDLFPKVKQELHHLNNEKAILFIDPYGYKEVNPDIIKEFLSYRNAEIILFLPISFMYRFFNKSLNDDEFHGGAALRTFLSSLMEKNNDFQSVTSIYQFVIQLKNAFRYFLKHEKIYVDTFTLQRDNQNTYCLFFFTPNELGFEKMLETKWKLDEQQGKGFKIKSNQTSLFDEVEVCDFSNEVLSFIKSSKYKTNSELYLFGLEKGFLPKHINKVLRNLQKSPVGLKVLSSDGKEARKGAFYINYDNFGKNPKKLIRFAIEN